jgi:ketosteroid isomerase-like protein
MSSANTSQLEFLQSYLRAIESGATGEALSRFFDPEVIQEEFPNRLLPNGARRDLQGILDAALRGQKVMTAQRFELLNVLESGDAAAVEIQWTGTLAVAFGSLPVGGELRARFAIFVKFRDGRIVSQHNYDCFEAW